MRMKVVDASAGSGPTLPHLLCEIISPTSNSNMWSQSMIPVLDHYRTGSNCCDRVARLIIEIVQALMDPGPTDTYADLKLELKFLQESFTLAGLAIRAYEYTPLGQNLVSIINQLAEQCLTIL